MCLYRSNRSIGKVRCNCSNQPEVFACSLPWVASGYCMPTLPSKPGDGPIVKPDGERIVPADDRREAFVPWPLRNGDLPRTWEVIVCDTCPQRAEPPPHVKELRRLGIEGNYDPDTGQADIVHVVPEYSEHWSQHADDYANSAPAGMRACWMATKAFPNISEILELTKCKLIIANLHMGQPAAIRDAANASPNIRFVIVYHGTQNQLVQLSYLKDQTEVLRMLNDTPNLWFAHVEPTTPWGELGYQRIVHWPNTMPFTADSTPAPAVDPPALLIGGRRCMEKAHPTGILAAALMQRQRQVLLYAAIREGTGQLRDVAKSAGIEIHEEHWRHQKDFRKWLRANVSVTFQTSLCDSFNYLALDSLSQGRPVVGSQTIRYLPKEWQADPNDPADIARIATMFLDDYDWYSAEALRIAVEVRDRQQAAYQALIARILD